ncbi:MAG TPA: phosphoribosylanthranilate isomerase [Acidobacteriaceae bacterium]|nr:phosphoribosylanthranilate isomerase [Acidobacteriaceae bacterium]
MWIKICGNTNLEDARFAAQCGANAVGFVFAPSPRQVNVETVRQIARNLPPELETYGVFADAGLEDIVSAVNTCGLTGVQLHRSSDDRLPALLRDRLDRISILSVLHYKGDQFKGDQFEHQMMETAQNTALNGVLVDSSTTRAIGGTGVSFNWSEARNAFLRVAPKMRLVAAGGLSPENVQQAIQTLQPWGVDVVTGVEQAPGKKDPAKVLAFIRAAREASTETAQSLEERLKA